MTLIGAFKPMSDVVIFADRQEGITDYAKWDANKIGYFEFQDDVRFVAAGAGDSNTIDMIWEQVCTEVRQMAIAHPSKIKAPEIKELILRTVSRITRKCILPYPRNDRPWVDLIWAVQQIRYLPELLPPWGINLFHTYGLTVNSIGRKYFTGNPILLVRYLSDMYLDNLIIGTEEAEALAVYLLWEAKEYDPTCGKHSDVITLKADGAVRRLTLNEVKYWEDHFMHLKQSLKLIPLLSCATNLTNQMYDPRERVQRFLTALRTLTKEQRKMRIKTKDLRSQLEKKLTANLRRTAVRFSKASKARKLKGQQ